jgi:hypothetical protein
MCGRAYCEQMLGFRKPFSLQSSERIRGKSRMIFLWARFSKGKPLKKFLFSFAVNFEF